MSVILSMYHGLKSHREKRKTEPKAKPKVEPKSEAKSSTKNKSNKKSSKKSDKKGGSGKEVKPEETKVKKSNEETAAAEEKAKWATIKLTRSEIQRIKREKSSVLSRFKL